MIRENGDAVQSKVEQSSHNELAIQKRRGLIYQMTMSVFANISILGPAMSMGYSAVVLPTLRSKSSDIKITTNQESWIAGAAAFGTPLGCILSSFFMRRGRRVSLMVTSCFSLIGWLLIYMSTNYEKLVVGRIIGGIATGLASVSASVYTAEIAVSSWRSTMVTWSSMGIATGILLVYIIGYFIQNWQTIALICSLFPAASIILIILSVPESPLWLRDRGRMDEARVVMKKFRGIPKEYPITPEIESELQNPQPNINVKKRSPMRYLLKRSSLMPFSIMLGYFLFQQLSGLFVIVFYAVDIVSEAGIRMDANLGAILIGTTRLIGTALTVFTSKRWGRRFPSIASGAGMTFFMGILSLYVFLTNRGYKIPDGGFTPAICILMYIFMGTVGFFNLPFAMTSEIYPTKVRDIFSGLTVCIAYIFSFITVKIYPDMLTSMGKYGVFLFYAFFSLTGTIFVTLFLPETKGKTLHEIDRLFSQKNKNIIDSQEAMEAEKMYPMKDVAQGSHLKQNKIQIENQ